MSHVALIVKSWVMSTAYCIWSVVSPISMPHRVFSSLRLVATFRWNQSDSGWGLRLNNTPIAIGCTWKRHFALFQGSWIRMHNIYVYKFNMHVHICVFYTIFAQSQWSWVMSLFVTDVFCFDVFRFWCTIINCRSRSTKVRLFQSRCVCVRVWERGRDSEGGGLGGGARERIYTPVSLLDLLYVTWKYDWRL